MCKIDMMIKVILWLQTILKLPGASKGSRLSFLVQRIESFRSRYFLTTFVFNSPLGVVFKCIIIACNLSSSFWCFVIKAGVISTRGETEVRGLLFSSVFIAKISISSSSLSSSETGFVTFFFRGGAANLCSLADSSI